MEERLLFTAFVAVITCLTAHRAAGCDSGPRLFLNVCVVAQLVALTGLLTKTHWMTGVSHVSFTTLLWVGAFTLPKGSFERGLVCFLAAFTLFTRHALGHCMFSHARGSQSTNDAKYDVLYLVPFLMAAA